MVTGTEPPPSLSVSFSSLPAPVKSKGLDCLTFTGIQPEHQFPWLGPTYQNGYVRPLPGIDHYQKAFSFPELPQLGVLWEHKSKKLERIIG